MTKKVAENGYIYKMLISFSDLMILTFSPVVALLMRYDFIFPTIPDVYWSRLVFYLPYNLMVTIGVFYLSRLYNMVWRFVSTSSVIRIAAAVFISSLINVFLSILIDCRFPISVYCIQSILIFVLCTTVRFSYRIILYLKNSILKKNIKYNERIMIIGAGKAGDMLINELISSVHIDAKVCCLIDDDSKMHGRLIKGIPIVGGREEIKKAVTVYNITKIIFAIPSASKSTKEEILNICKLTNCKLLTLPGIYQLLNGEVQISKLRDVCIEDLLGRESVDAVPYDVVEYIKGRVVIVTGGGGSIGSELCRQLAQCQPKQLIILDKYENNAYDIQIELKEKYQTLDLVVLIASVRDAKRMDMIFEKYRPDIVFHAAAHKHVPLMEDNPSEAIKNNVFGTMYTAQAAMRHNTKRFVLISTDKAVNPTSVMGATKRICEMLVQSFDKKSKTDFVAVRFGNVLGSNGSVIPLFKKQIEAGGPVKVTDPEIIRFFMTISEAVSLVLQAGSYAKGGEIFVLDMGNPVKILALAENLIRLSGYTPYTDIPIVFTGLRPGEKLYEETLMEEEGLQETQNHLIHIGKPIQVDEDRLFSTIDIMEAEITNDSCNIRAIVKEIVPTYQYNGQIVSENSSVSEEETVIDKNELEPIELIRKNAVV